jgi:hypothetical protein
MNLEQSEWEPSEELAQWLVESGRRRSPLRLPPVVVEPKAPQALSRDVPTAGVLTRIILVALLAVAYLQYFFADALLQIAKLRSVIVFLWLT